MLIGRELARKWTELTERLRDGIARWTGLLAHDTKSIGHTVEGAANEITDVESGVSDIGDSIGTEPRFSDEEFAARIDSDRSRHNTRLLTDDEIEALRLVDPIRRNVQNSPGLTESDIRIISRYTGAHHMELNKPLQNGTLTDLERDRVDALQRALSKLPDYHGIVRRDTNLRPDELDRYQRGAVITEKRFTSTTAGEEATFPGKVEFRIISKTGKYIAPYSYTPREHEVLFRPGDQFEVIDRRSDPQQGRTVIYMVQI
ncbi:ADP-ribosyltransferase [Nocardia brevicatena]|uniref:ADP-ribosyltransferase n=1 Tax=Nocardia brevicatena TaxID=37327 RepID=UPI000A008C78|nr:ADP-ribosyltransferase [Nocardia brevicatena]